MFVRFDQENKASHYSAAEQTWLPACGHGGDAGRYYVGIWNDKPPTEPELLKPDHRRGMFVTMANSEKWSITTPGHLDRFAVPQTDGSVDWVVDTTFNCLTTDLDRIRAHRVKEREDGTAVVIFSDDGADFYFLCDVLRINYQVTPELVGYLKLLSAQSIRPLIGALLGRTLREDTA